MKPKYKGKMRQKQRERAQANRVESKESNKPKNMSVEWMRKRRFHTKKFSVVSLKYYPPHFFPH
jgi:hypothetical protein